MLFSLLSPHGRSPGRALTALAVAIGTVLALTATTAEAARDFSSVCPDPPPTAYDDRGEIADAHRDAVRCLTELGIVQGLGSDVGVFYFPGAEVTRAQMASFVANMLTEAGVELPAPSDQGFEDVDDESVHAAAIRQLAEAGVVDGVTEDRYAGHEFVTRAQMATYLIGAQAHAAGVENSDLQGGDTPFTDVVPDDAHAASIAGAFELGITDGVTENRYAPAGNVTRQAMASFVARTLDAVVTRRTVADFDNGALAHTVFTFLSEGGRCFQVTAGEAWAAQCDPAPGEEPLQVYTVAVGDAFTVVAGVVTGNVDRVVIETADGQEVEATDFVQTRSENLLAWASPRLLDDVAAVVAYAGGEEVARTSPDDPAAPPFDANMQPDTAEGSGEPVTVTGIRVAHHQTYDRAVFDLAGDGLPGWEVKYVDAAKSQGSGQEIELAGDAILRVLLNNIVYPPGDNQLEMGSLPGADTIREVYFDTSYEGYTQAFLGLDSKVPFRAFALEGPPRLVVDVVHPDAAG